MSGIRWSRLALFVLGCAALAFGTGFFLALVIHGWALIGVLAAVLIVAVVVTYRPVTAWVFEPRRPRAWTEDQLP